MARQSVRRDSAGVPHPYPHPHRPYLAPPPPIGPASPDPAQPGTSSVAFGFTILGLNTSLLFRVSYWWADKMYVCPLYPIHRQPPLPQFLGVFTGRGGGLAPNDLGGVGEASPRDSPSKEGDTSVNHVRSTTQETSSYGDPEPRSLSRIHTPKKPRRSLSEEGDDTDDTQGPVYRKQSASNQLQAQV